MFGEAKYKKSKSKQSNGSGNLAEEQKNEFETKKAGGTTAKSMTLAEVLFMYIKINGI